MRAAQKFWRREFHQFALYFIDRFSRRELHSIGDAKDVGVDGERGFAERFVEHDVCGFSADAGQRFERRAVVGHFTTVQCDELPGGGDRVLRFVAKEADRFDHVGEISFAHREQIGGGFDRWKKSSRCGVD